MFHCVLWCNSLSMIVAKHTIEKVQSFLSDKLFVGVVDEFLPALLFVLSKDIIVVPIESYIVFLNVSIEVVCSQNFCNLDKLIIIIFALEEWFFLENHTCEHASKGPDI